ncbi:MAG: hypothetical protein KF868_18855 [Acidobacteria bacterium]|nr:hypothetical protein [Acidobacteriota bacterium]
MRRSGDDRSVPGSGWKAMGEDGYALRRGLGRPVALDTGLDEAVEFGAPERRPVDWYFSPDGCSDLVMVTEDVVGAVVEYAIDLDEAVECVLDGLVDEAAAAVHDRLNDIAALRVLARRFEEAAVRLHQEAGDLEKGLRCGCCSEGEIFGSEPRE